MHHLPRGLLFVPVAHARLSRHGFALPYQTDIGISLLRWLLALGIDPDVVLQAEAPRSSPASGLHVWISLPRLVPGEGWRHDSRHIHDRRFPWPWARGAPIAVDMSPRPPIMPYEEMKGPADRRFIRCLTRLQVSNSLHGQAVVQGILHDRIGATILLLHEIDAQHGLQRHRRTAAQSPGMEGRDHRTALFHGNRASIRFSSCCLRVL